MRGALCSLSSHTPRANKREGGHWAPVRLAPKLSHRAAAPSPTVDLDDVDMGDMDPDVLQRENGRAGQSPRHQLGLLSHFTDGVTEAREGEREPPQGCPPGLTLSFSPQPPSPPGSCLPILVTRRKRAPGSGVSSESETLTFLWGPSRAGLAFSPFCPQSSTPWRIWEQIPYQVLEGLPQTGHAWEEHCFYELPEHQSPAVLTGTQSHEHS